MKVSFECKYLGFEERAKKNGGTYKVLGLLQGFEAEELFMSEDVEKMVKDLKPMDFVEVNATIRIAGENSRMMINSIVPLPAPARK